MAAVALVTHPSSLQHDPSPGHPERPERVRAILDHLRATPLWPSFRHLEPPPAARDALTLVHPEASIAEIEQACRQAPMALDPDTLVSPGSWEAALHAAGAASEVGRGQGTGTTLNVPLPAGSGDAEALEAFDTKLAPAARQCHPDLILISAGFDAHRDDPLAQLEWTDDGYAALTRRVKQLATELCRGRLVSALEGGYDLDALSRSVEAHVQALAE